MTTDEVLIAWWLHEKGVELDLRDSQTAYLELEAGLEIFEPCRADGDPRCRAHQLGQLAMLSGYRLDMLSDKLLAGYCAEFNDHHDSVIALRRMTARGA